MHFIDQVQISVAAGGGGNGCVSFLRERFRPKGGPDGGDGGRGGSIILKGQEGLNTLVEFHFRNQFRARRGEHGKGKTQHGKSGKDSVIPVPVGTVVEDSEAGQILGEILANGQSLLVAAGGRGGRGNAHFVSPTNQAPRRADTGQPGEGRRLRLTLKLLADIGLVGFPNAGKSSLLAKISAARPKIAPYPFTTLTPVLGYVRVGELESFIMADIPGLIEGAHRGTGLGIQFLKHLERTRLLVHILDLSEPEGTNPGQRYEQLNQELGLYHPGLLAKPQLVAGNKIDLLPDQAVIERWVKFFQARSVPFFPISALTGAGTKELIGHLWKALKSEPGG